jgi:hypothetical protein
MNKSRLLTTLACAALLLVGFLLGGGWNVAEANAVETQAGGANGAWEIYHGTLNSAGDFYAIKHNRLTGETLVFSTYSEPSEDWRRPNVTIKR